MVDKKGAKDKSVKKTLSKTAAAKQTAAALFKVSTKQKTITKIVEEVDEGNDFDGDVNMEKGLGATSAEDNSGNSTAAPP